MSIDLTGATAVDVHAHAMPMPLLSWLADRGLADLSGVEQGVVRIDPMVSGVGRGAPLPLARSMFDAQVRLAELDAAGVSHECLSLPPFLVASMATDEGFVTELIRRGTEALVEYCSVGGDRLVPLGGVPVGFPAAACVAREALADARLAGLAMGTRGAGQDLDAAVNDELWHVLHEG